MHVRARLMILPAVALLTFACGAQGTDLEPAGSPDADVDGTDTSASDAGGDEAADGNDADGGDATGDNATGDDATSDDASDDDASGDGQDTAPSPDAALLEDPCAEHEGREQDVFIDLVAPVDDQQVGEQVEIVGCANVFEATVLWRLLDGDGDVLEDGFTTATCGTGCVGEFRDEVSLAQAEGEPVAHLQVYWESAEDGSERDLVERVIALD